MAIIGGARVNNTCLPTNANVHLGPLGNLRLHIPQPTIILKPLLQQFLPINPREPTLNLAISEAIYITCVLWSRRCRCGDRQATHGVYINRSCLTQPRVASLFAQKSTL
jgi:hypothetical protein